MVKNEIFLMFECINAISITVSNYLIYDFVKACIKDFDKEKKFVSINRIRNNFK